MGKALTCWRNIRTVLNSAVVAMAIIVSTTSSGVYVSRPAEMASVIPAAVIVDSPEQTWPNTWTPPDDPNVIAQFFAWLNACVEGQLDFDPGCREAATDLSLIGVGVDDVVECAQHAAEAVAAGKPGKALGCLESAAQAAFQAWESSHGHGG
ncbi:hypothetical protein BKA01_003354 [Pseudonocardia eucalypti]|nr:hypothetical protein [Pseudonocardia eucalypti]